MIKPYTFLYLAFGIYCVTDRMWIYVVSFTLGRLEGLRLVGLSQLLQSTLSMMLSSHVGRQLDCHNRLTGAFASTVSNNSCMMLAALSLLFCNCCTLDGILYQALLISAILLVALGKVASDGELIVLNRDWIVVLARSERGKRSTLSVRNAAMTTIYQTCSIGAPVMGGFLISYLGVTQSCVFFIAWSLLAMIIKVALLKMVYRDVPSLAERHIYKVSVIDSDSLTPAAMSPLREYVKQTVFPAAFGLAALYVTVFEFDALVIGYTESRGLSANVVGTFGSASAVFGLVGSLFYTLLEKYIKANYAGLVGVTCYCIAVSPCILSLFLPGGIFSETHSRETVFVYLGGVCLGRFGFWMIHMAVTQIIQETVPESNRSAVFGVQNAACQLFVLLKNLLVSFVPGNLTFSFLIVVSSVTLVLVEFCYVFYIYREKHIGKKEPSTEQHLRM